MLSWSYQESVILWNDLTVKWSFYQLAIFTTGDLTNWSFFLVIFLSACHFLLMLFNNWSFCHKVISYHLTISSIIMSSKFVSSTVILWINYFIVRLFDEPSVQMKMFWFFSIFNSWSFRATNPFPILYQISAFFKS
jgi:hypothetical protein